jgi:hypothetical protein
MYTCIDTVVPSLIDEVVVLVLQYNTTVIGKNHVHKAHSTTVP